MDKQSEPIDQPVTVGFANTSTRAFHVLDGAVSAIKLDETTRHRKIKTVDKTGNVVREVRGEELVGALAKADALVNAIEPGKELDVKLHACQRQVVCAGLAGDRCPIGAPISTNATNAKAIKRRGYEPWICTSCRRRRDHARRTPEQKTSLSKTLSVSRRAKRTVDVSALEKQEMCAGFDGPCPQSTPISKSGAKIGHIKRRGYQPWLCPSCARLKWDASRTPEQRSDASRKAMFAQTPERRKERARKAGNTPKRARSKGERT